MKNQLRQLLSRQQPAFGLIVKSSDPMTMELIGLAGFDFVFLDLEHTPMSLETVLNLIRTGMATGLGMLVRTPGLEPEYIFRLLDMGAEGILVPGLEGPGDVARVVRASRFPPIGERGISPSSRVADYGAHGKANVRELTEHLNREQVVGVLVENKAAVESIETIVATRGVDFVFIGPVDLSSSLGVLGAKRHPELLATIERVVAACNKASMPFGTIANDSAASLTTSELNSLGARLVVVGIDSSLMLSRLTALRSEIAAGRC